MAYSPIRTLAERIASTRPRDQVALAGILGELKELRVRFADEVTPEHLDRLDASVLLLEFMATVEDAVSADALRVVGRLVATLDIEVAEPAVRPPAPEPEPPGESAPEIRAGDLRASQSALLGQLLVESGLIDIEGLGEALCMQLTSDRPIGECMVELGLVSRENLDEALRLQDEIRGEGVASDSQEAKSTPEHEPDHGATDEPDTSTGVSFAPPFTDEELPQYDAPPVTQYHSGSSSRHLTVGAGSREFMSSAMSYLLGEVLVRQGVIGRKELYHALSCQRKKGQSIGETLVSMGAATRSQVEAGLRVQRRFR